MPTSFDVVIVGAGIFGVTAALELHERGHYVALLDPGPLPHPLAASTDISKAVRIEYGPDEFYTALAEEALTGWRAWNDQYQTDLYHEVGLLMLTRQPLAPGEFTYDSYQLLQRRGHGLERLGPDEIDRRFPAWNTEIYIDGYYNPVGGYARSGHTVETLLAQAKTLGVSLHPDQAVIELLSEGERVTGVRTQVGAQFTAGHVLLAIGSWTPLLLPELEPLMQATAHPVFHFEPPDPSLFRPPHMAVFSADVANTGWYGFPLNPHAGVVKLANHGVGQSLHPTNDPRTVPEAKKQTFRKFLADTFPAAAEAPLVKSHLCPYCDTLDGHFWIDRHPERPGLTVASGGSGHALKFAPLLGGWQADALEGRDNPALERFRWRELDKDTVYEEGTRFQGD